MLWFKNAIIYQFTDDNLMLTKEKVEEALKSHLFVPCGSLDTSKFGWTSSYGDDHESLVLEVQGQILLTAKQETKIIPSSVIKQELNQKVEKLELAHGRKLRKAEKESAKDEVMIDLLPRAFSKYRYYSLWIDMRNRRLVVNTSSFKQAEDLLALLRKCLGSLAITPMHFDTPLEKLMTEWVKENRNLAPFQFADAAELKDPLEGNGIIRCRKQEIHSEEILSHINAGKQVTQLKLLIEDALSFTLHNDFTIKNIKYESIVLDKNLDIDKEDKEKRNEADFILMSEILNNAINNFINLLNSE